MRKIELFEDALYVFAPRRIVSQHIIQCPPGGAVFPLNRLRGFPRLILIRGRLDLISRDTEGFDRRFGFRER